MSTTKFWSAAVVRLTIHHPFFTEVLYSMELAEGFADGTPKVDTACTDSRTLWLNREFFEKLSLDEQMGLIAHEVCHKIFLHPTRRGMREPGLANVAMDLAINPILIDNGFKLPAGGLNEPKYKGWLFERIYSDLKDEREKQGGGGGKPDPSAPWEDVIEPEGMTADEKAALEEETKAIVERAAANAMAMGRAPAGIAQGLTQAYKAAAEPWHNHLHRYMQALSQSTYSWARINRRALLTHGVFAPHHYSEALGDVVVFVDTSGSCYEAAQQVRFAEHLNAILSECKPQRTWLYYFDTRVYPGEEIEPGQLEIQTNPKGGGGTSFEPLFERLDEDGIVPDVCIVLTDMEGSFPADAPEYPVVWASILKGKRAPWGELIEVSND